VNHQLESRMREIRQSGSEGGGTKPIASPYPYREKSFKLRLYLKLRRTFHSVSPCDLGASVVK